MRDARASDAATLVAIWNGIASPDRSEVASATDEQTARAIARLEADPAERLLVALLDDVLVGVAHVRRAPISPIHDEDAVHVGNLHVLRDSRRRGVGSSLMAAAADWAEEKDSRHIIASVAASARDSNRFLARLGMGQAATVRASTVAGLRARLGHAVAKPVSTNVVAARRLMRRARG
ncbi:MAG: GNAT family N-acetyltransferase [Propionibacteriales bacterium]|nr:GNAT family N-acetyltransferase [Propionibacteriales bacterium]